MRLRRRQVLQWAAGAAALPGVSRIAAAEVYPSRPLHLIVPFAAGGTTDVIARLIAQWLTERLGQPVVVENRPGGGTNIAVQAVATAPADGYTLLFTVASNTINPFLYKSLPFDFQRDIAPVSGLAEQPLVLDESITIPAKTLPEFIAEAKAHPGKINFASFGTRTISHLAIELLKMSTGVDVVHVPYPGGAPLVTDLLAGRVQAGIDALPNSLPHIRVGTIRGLAVLSAARSPAVPDVPTVAETVPGFEVTTWTGVGVPRGTSADVIERLNREINAGLKDPGIMGHLAEVGSVPMVKTPDEMRALIARETAKWERVIKVAGIEPE
jgi:tripartite-type tricarboxylate transporter receptor subunit TctC